MGSLPASALVLAVVLRWWPLLPGEHAYAKGMPLSLQFALIVFFMSVPAFAIGLFLCWRISSEPTGGSEHHPSNKALQPTAGRCEVQL